MDRAIKNRIKESSQGLPWLTKKLCIHIHNQIIGGSEKEGLIDSNLNIKDLFEKDEEGLNADEVQALKVIAKRAYEGSFFDESEVGELISNATLISLLHKRLIIRSGANYNIYWDIFRDYLVTGEIPTIGESYLLRQMVSSCLDIFLLFEEGKTETIESLISKIGKPIGEDAIYNILLELRNIGLIKKDRDNYRVKDSLMISKDAFKAFITNKFENYTPLITLERLNEEKISKETISDVLKHIFKQDFQDNTWDAYAKTLISWIMITDLEIKNRIVELRKGRGNISRKIILDNPEDLLPRTSLKEVMGLIPSLIFGSEEIDRKYYRDLMLLGIYDTNYELTNEGRNAIFKDDSENIKNIRDKVLQLPKMKKILDLYNSNNKIKAKDLVETMPKDFFAGEKESTKIIYALKALTWVKNRSL